MYTTYKAAIIQKRFSVQGNAMTAAVPIMLCFAGIVLKAKRTTCQRKIVTGGAIEIVPPLTHL